MACITTPTFSININGDDCASFKWGRGLRQGDPLSPLLFVLVMEYLTRLYNQTGTQARFKFHPSCKGNKLNHMIFPDDLIVFCAADINSVTTLKDAFTEFSSATGMEANLNKS